MTYTEKQFEGQVRDLATNMGWKYYHTWRSIHSPAGWPDVVLCRPPRLIIAELKADKGIVTDEQRVWLENLGGCPACEVFIWRPGDLEEIARILGRVND